MNHNHIFIRTISVICVLFCAGVLHAKDDTPSAKAVQPQFQFTPVVEGQEVIHDFIIQNTGAALLEITNVKPG